MDGALWTELCLEGLAELYKAPQLTHRNFTELLRYRSSESHHAAPLNGDSKGSLPLRTGRRTIPSSHAHGAKRWEAETRPSIERLGPGAGRGDERF